MRGHVVRQPAGYWAFLPPSLPPPLALTGALVASLSEADRALGELAGAGGWLPDPHLLIRPFLRREAALSSRIEGTVSTVTDLVLFEATISSMPSIRSWTGTGGSDGSSSASSSTNGGCSRSRSCT